MFLLFNFFYNAFLYWGELFTTYVAWYVDTHESTIFIPSTNVWWSLTYFFLGCNKWFNDGQIILFMFFLRSMFLSITLYPLFVLLTFSKSFQTNALLQWFLALCLFSSACYFSVFYSLHYFSKYCKYVIVPLVSYGTWNSTSLTSLAYKHDYTIHRKWRQ